MSTVQDDIILGGAPSTDLPTAGVEEIEREHPAGLLRFENFPAGTWRTKKGDPAKKAKRRYLIDGNEIDSVSSIVDTLSKDALVRWAEDHGMRGAVQAERMGELEGVPPEEFIDRVHALGLGASAARDEGAARGTAIHAALHGLAVDGTAPNPADFPPEWRPWLQGAVAAWLELDLVEIVASEVIRASIVHGYGGRPDLIGRRSSGALALIDYKSGKGKVYDQAHIQTRLYDIALREEDIAVDEILIVGIDDRGGHELVKCEANEHAALATLALFRYRKQINAGMATQRKARRAAAKAAA